MKKLKILSSGGAIPSTFIREAEKALQVKLPDSYIRFVSKNDEASLESGFFVFYDIAWRNYNIALAAGFLGHAPNSILGLSEFILRNKQLLENEILRGVLAFMDEPFGNFICFDYRDGWNNVDPTVVYWNHEAPDGEDVSPVAPNFDAFLNMLTTEEEAVAEMNRLNAELKKSRE